MVFPILFLEHSGIRIPEYPMVYGESMRLGQMLIILPLCRISTEMGILIFYAPNGVDLIGGLSKKGCSKNWVYANILSLMVLFGHGTGAMVNSKPFPISLMEISQPVSQVLSQCQGE